MPLIRNATDWGVATAAFSTMLIVLDCSLIGFIRRNEKDIIGRRFSLDG
jgi:hypothetical protein